MLDAHIRMKFGTAAEPNPFRIDVHLRAADGVTVLFGHSGAGKTSILRAVAGILTPDEGRITLGQRRFFDSADGVHMPIQDRRVGFVFQNHALFPHLTAEQNVLYGARSDSRQSARQRVQELFALLGIRKTAAQYPRELSGGEQQRVALARALATEPQIMLLDEPLSAVDVATRSRLLEEISDMQTRSGIPFLYVTHNHSEAVRLGTTMYVIHEGKVIQKGSPLEIFNAPRSAPAARIVGTENVFIGRILDHHPEDGTTTIDLNSCHLEVPYNGLPAGSRITVGIRSEDIILSREHLTQTSARNVLPGIIKHIIRDVGKAELVVSCGIDFKVSITPATVRILRLETGSPVYLLIKARALHLLA